MLAWAVMVASALLASAALADNGLLPPPLACGPLPRAIALITGFARASSRAMAALEANAELLGAHVLAPLDADVVLVYEAGSCAGARVSPAAGCTTESLEALVETALIRKLGRRLLAVGVVEGVGVPRARARAPEVLTVSDGSLRAWLRPADPRTSRSVRAFDRHGKGAMAQWHKLREAWRLMETLEQSGKFKYGLVIKLRLDLAPSVPMAPCAHRDGLLEKIGQAAHALQVHAMTDWMFWGSREAMAIACSVWDGVGYFENSVGEPFKGISAALGPPRSDVLKRPVAVRPLLLSLRSLPPDAFERWLPYHKIESLAVPDMGKFPNTFFVPANRVTNLKEVRLAMLANLEAALAAGWEWIDPLDTKRAAQPKLRLMISEKSGRVPPGLFITEQDFLHWLMLHNITVCDIGAGVSGFFSKKRRVVSRPTVNDCLHPPSFETTAKSENSASLEIPAELETPAKFETPASLQNDAKLEIRNSGLRAPGSDGGLGRGLGGGLGVGLGDGLGGGLSGGLLQMRFPNSIGPQRQTAVSEDGTQEAGGDRRPSALLPGQCAPAPAKRAEFGKTGAARGEVRRVAVCFHGQFLRRADIPKLVSQILPGDWGGPDSKTVAYDAFVATSTQRSELSACEVLDGSQICPRLVKEAGFGYAQCDHLPYDAGIYTRMASSLGLPQRDAARYSLYPHRVLSSFSTMSRALSLARAHSELQSAKGGYYDLIALTRIDVFFHNVKVLSWPITRSWFIDVAAVGVVGRRRAHKPQWEDRFIIGRPELMESLERLSDGATFARRYKQLGNQAYPEAQILLALTESGKLQTHNTRGPFFSQFASIEGFKQNKQKFRRNFINLSAIV